MAADHDEIVTPGHPLNCNCGECVYGRRVQPVERILDRIPDADWDVDVWLNGNYLTGRLDAADRRRIVERVLSEAAECAACEGTGSGYIGGGSPLGQVCPECDGTGAAPHIGSREATDG